MFLSIEQLCLYVPNKAMFCFVSDAQTKLPLKKKKTLILEDS